MFKCESECDKNDKDCKEREKQCRDSCSTEDSYRRSFGFRVNANGKPSFEFGRTGPVVLTSNGIEFEFAGTKNTSITNKGFHFKF